MKKSALLIPVLFLALLGLLLWHPWRPDEVPRSAAVPESGELPAAAPAGPGSTPPVYEQRAASPGGTGRIYMGREISQVMGHEGIDWLERDSREDEEAPSRAVSALELAPDAVIADIGAGSGYYTFRLSKLFPAGRIIAVDIQPEMIEFLEARAAELGRTNVSTHLGDITDAGLSPGSIDAALLVDSYHEFSHPREMMESIVNALRPGGRVFLIEYRAEDPAVPIKPLHKMSEAQAVAELEAAGLEWETTHGFLPWQHLIVFRKPDA